MAISSKYQLPQSYYLQPDVVKIAKDLIGKIVFSNIDGNLTAAIITETEAYEGITDKASHAYGTRRTKRTETLYLEGGYTYVYLIYGIHHLLNVVTNKKDIPHAVLIRGGYPIRGIETMLKRNNNKKIDKLSLIGPGRFSKLLGITTNLDAIKFQFTVNKNCIWIEDWGLTKKLDRFIEVSKRIGIDYAEEDAELQYRFYLPPKSDEIISKLKQISKPIDH